MNGGGSISLQNHEVTVHNHCMPQFDLFQTHTTAYKPLAKDSSQIRILNQGKENSQKFPILAGGVFLKIFFLENYDFSQQLKEVWQQ